MRTVSNTWTRGRKTVTLGDALLVKGLRGQVRFRGHARSESGRESIEVVHPEFGFYSVTPDRVSAIPRKSTLREHTNLAALAVTA
jgi:hypothetical protein